MVVTVSHAGYVKRVPLSAYRAQRRGGKGRAGVQMRDEDFVTKLFVANTHTPILFFSSLGMVYRMKVWRLPVGNPQARGKALINILPLSQDERITTIMPLPEDDGDAANLHLMFATRSGGVRRNALDDFESINRSGKIAMKLEAGDMIAGVEICTAADDVLLTTAQGQCIRFPVDDVRVFRAAYGRALTSATQSVLYRSTAVNYMWDDHDFGPNNSDRTSPSRAASRAAYREMVPHYPLADEAAIYHAFTIGRVRFIVSDTRSERDPPGVPEGPARTMLGAKQKAWLKHELLAARDTAALIVWVNSVPWIGRDTGSENEDRWTGFTTERAEIAAFLEQHDIRNLCVISGDAHMLAIDDGSNNRFGPAGRQLFPVFHAAALDRKGSVKGGPYSHGAFGGPGQFGLMRVQDDGGPELRVEWSGRNHEDVELLRHVFTTPAP